MDCIYRLILDPNDGVIWPGEGGTARVQGVLVPERQGWIGASNPEMHDGILQISVSVSAVREGELGSLTS
jgi:hypothetical protein